MAPNDAAESDTDTDAEERDESTITYQFECPADTWRPWTNTIPRSVPIAERLRTLIEQDLAGHQQAQGMGGDVDEDKDKDTALLATRIRIRATQAAAALRESDDTDPDTAREQLRDIRQLAEALES